jgi:hypothetical protein
MNKNLPALVVLAAAAALAPAAAQNVYRCGDSYSQRPCPGGILVPTEDTRNASQRAQTSAAAQRDAKTADAMEKARLKEEAKPVAGYIPAPKEAETIAPEAKPGLVKPKKPQYFTAAAPRKPGEAGAKKKKKKVKKQAL